MHYLAVTRQMRITMQKASAWEKAVLEIHTRMYF